MNVVDAPPADERKLKTALDRARQYADRQRGDILTLAGPMLFELIKAKPFGARSNQAGVALTMAFLMRHGVVIAAAEDLVDICAGISGGQIYMGVLDQWMRESARVLH
jgi:prophage maintenance system killer protein